MQHFDEITPLNPATNASRRGAKTLQDLILKGAIDREQANFVIAATDPFHDKPLNHLTGCPDGQVELSVTPSYVSELTISRPPGYTGTTWNAMISNQALLTTVQMGVADLIGNIISLPYANISESYVGSVNITTADGADDFSTIYHNPHYRPLNPPIDALEGPLQVIGMAIEVEDITAALHRQGAFHCAIQNQHPHKLTTLNGTPNISGMDIEGFVSGSFFEIRRPPANLAQLCLLPGIVDWRSEDGCFAVIREHYDQFSHVSTLPTYPILTNSDLPPGPLPVSPLRVSTVPVSIYDWGEGKTQATLPGNVVPNPSQMTVMMFTGLAPESVLQMRVRWFIQRFPTESQRQIIPLARLPPPRNDKCYELISRIFTTLPPAVPFAQNSSGEWWRTILEGIGAIAPAISMIPHPIAQAVSAGASAVGKLAKNDESELERLRREIALLKEQLKECQKRMIQPALSQSQPPRKVLATPARKLIPEKTVKNPPVSKLPHAILKKQK